MIYRCLFVSGGPWQAQHTEAGKSIDRSAIRKNLAKRAVAHRALSVEYYNL
jgi:hypothetical protein